MDHPPRGSLTPHLGTNLRPRSEKSMSPRHTELDQEPGVTVQSDRGTGSGGPGELLCRERSYKVLHRRADIDEVHRNPARIPTIHGRHCPIPDSADRPIVWVLEAATCPKFFSEASANGHDGPRHVGQPGSAVMPYSPGSSSSVAHQRRCRRSPAAASWTQPPLMSVSASCPSVLYPRDVVVFRRGC